MVDAQRKGNIKPRTVHFSGHLSPLRHVARQEFHSLYAQAWSQRLVCELVLYIGIVTDRRRRKVATILEELGLTYESIYLDFGKGEQKEERHTKYNPNGRIPTLIDHQNNDFTLWYIHGSRNTFVTVG